MPDAKTPYGPKAEVDYADPGYQADGVARYPIDSPEHVRSAWSYVNQADNADRYTPEQLGRIKQRILAAGKKYGIQFDDEGEHEPMGPEEDEPMGRRSYDQMGPEILRYDRTWALDDIEIVRGGDGRTVEAYAAVFDVPTEIHDQHGDYYEVIHRSAFNRAISHGIDRVGVYYNHGMGLDGRPAALGHVPIGSPLEVQADAKGLRTLTRYNKSQLADSVLEAIRNGDIRGYSFRGRIFQSNPPKPPGRARSASLPTITRMELGLAEYGPTPTPYYADAGILAVRSAHVLADSLLGLDEAARSELLRIISASTPRDPEAEHATPDPGPGAEDSPDEALRSASQYRRKIAVAEILGVFSEH